MFFFDKTSRLLNKKDYEHVFSKANKIAGFEFIVLHCENNVGKARLGFVLSKKKIAKASQRNRMRRLVRESFRTHQLPAVDIIFLAKPYTRKLKNNLITSNLNKIWDQLAIFYDS